MIVKRACSGQALLPIIFILAALLILSTCLPLTSIQISERIKLQNIADGSSLQASTIMADGLNLIAISNAAMIALGVSAFFSSGATLEYIRQIQHFQDEIIAITPKLAITAAFTFQLREQQSIRFISQTPDMRVNRAYFRFLWVKIPLWCKDTNQIDRRRTVIRFLYANDNKWFTNSASIPKGGRLIGKYIVWPLPAPTYRGYQVKSN